MGDLDNLLGSRISLITIQDLRYDGVLFSINAAESSIVLKDVRTLGTEDRVTDPSKKVAATANVISFVSFPGAEIKDLYVHEPKSDEAQPPPAPAPAQAPQQQQQQQRQQRPQSSGDGDRPPRPPSQGRGWGNPNAAASNNNTQHDGGGRGAGRGRGRGGGGDNYHQGGRGGAGRGERREPREPREPRDNGPATAAGTGAHLLRMRVKGGDGAAAEATAGDFDFQAGLTNFNKEVRAAGLCGVLFAALSLSHLRANYC